jgi:hypothetical protein
MPKTINKIKYCGTIIVHLTSGKWFVYLDRSQHDTLQSAKNWIDYLTK